MPQVGVHVVALRHDEVRQHRLAERELEPGAHLGDAQRVLECIRAFAEHRGHLRGALQVHLEAAVVVALRVLVAAVEPHALQVELRLSVGLIDELDVVRRDHRDADGLRRLAQQVVEHGLLGQPVILQLDEERALLEDVRELTERLRPGVLAVVADRLREHSAEAPGQRHEALRPFGHVRQSDRGDRLRGGRRIAHRDELDEVPVPLVVRRQDEEMVGVGPG